MIQSEKQFYRTVTYAKCEKDKIKGQGRDNFMIHA